MAHGVVFAAVPIGAGFGIERRIDGSDGRPAPRPSRRRRGRARMRSQSAGTCTGRWRLPRCQASRSRAAGPRPAISRAAPAPRAPRTQPPSSSRGRRRRRDACARGRSSRTASRRIGDERGCGGDGDREGEGERAGRLSAGSLRVRRSVRLGIFTTRRFKTGNTAGRAAAPSPARRSDGAVGADLVGLGIDLDDRQSRR